LSDLLSNGGWVYILGNKSRTTFYVGVTSDLENRVEEHRAKIYSKSFTSRYNIDTLLYYKYFNTIEDDIETEKQIKAGSRLRKSFTL